MSVVATDAEQLARVIGEKLKSPTPVHLKFDFDGTVAELRVYPDESRPHPTAFAAYRQLAEVSGVKVGVITGRWLDFIAPLFPEPFELDCSYGLEGRHDGEEWEHSEITAWKPCLLRFTDRVMALLKAEGAKYEFSARDAALEEAVYIERKPAGTSLHDAPARSGNPNTPVPRQIRCAIEGLGGNYDGLMRHDNNGNVEFSAPLQTDSGSRIDKGTVVGALDGFVVFSADDSGDLPAARQVKRSGGVVIAVNHQADSLRRGSPPELIEIADIVLDSVDEHAHFIAKVAEKVADLS